MLEVHSETVRGSECGVAVENWANSWKTSLKNVARQFHTEAMKSGGQFAALVLDPDGRMLDVAQMVQHKGKNSISHLLILLGGPGGISQADSDDLQTVLKEFVDIPIFSCFLPGGRMHSYCALQSLFALHDQAILLPFLSFLAKETLDSGKHTQKMSWR